MTGGTVLGSLWVKALEANLPAHCFHVMASKPILGKNIYMLRLSYVAVLEKFVQWLRSLYILCCLDKRTLAV